MLVMATTVAHGPGLVASPLVLHNMEVGSCDSPPPVSFPPRRLFAPLGSKSQDRLNHRHPAVQACGIRSEGSAILSAVDANQLCVEPQPLGGQEVPLGATAIF